MSKHDSFAGFEKSEFWWRTAEDPLTDVNTCEESEGQAGHLSEALPGLMTKDSAAQPQFSA